MKCWKLVIQWEDMSEPSEYELGPISFDTYKGGSISANYWCRGCPGLSVGTFPLHLVHKMERISS